MTPRTTSEKTHPSAETPVSSGSASYQVRIASGLILAAAAIAYSNTFSSPFLYDDVASILENPTIRRLWPPGELFNPPHANGVTVGGRPLLNLTLALNYAISARDVWSYHAGNLLIHALAGLTLFGLIRRTLQPTALAGKAGPLALFSALLWTLHPIQTESVTYIVQRAESLSGLLYLFTLYAFVCSGTSARKNLWLTLSGLACLLGMATKEIMVTAPLMVLLFDRTVATGGFAEALRRRAWYYAALGSSWLLLGWLVIQTGGNRGGTVGFGVGGAWWNYWLTQFRAIAHYLWLTVWPHPLVFDFGTFWIASLAEVALEALVVLAFLALTIFGLWRRSAWGLLGAWFFGTLAPTSLAPGTTQMIVEHRVYLSLAAPIALLVAGIHAAMGTRAWRILPVVAIACAVLTWSRNHVYRSEVVLWRDTTLQRPANARAWFMFANVLLESGRGAAAIDAYHTTLRLKPDYVEAHHNLGGALLQAGRVADALAQLEIALRLHPLPLTHFAAATALGQLGRWDEALAHCDAALRLSPHPAEALLQRGNLQAQAGRPTAALADYEAALRLSPRYVDARLNTAVVLLTLGRPAEALAQASAAHELNPNHGPTYWKLGDCLLQLGRMAEAIERYRTAVRLDATLVHAHHNLALTLVQSGRLEEALPVYERTLQLADGPVVRHQFAVALEKTGRIEQAVAQLEAALRLQPGFADAANHLATLRQRIPAAGSTPAPRR